MNQPSLRDGGMGKRNGGLKGRRYESFVPNGTGMCFHPCLLFPFEDENDDEDDYQCANRITFLMPLFLPWSSSL
jgi:hypothetical protein